MCDLDLPAMLFPLTRRFGLGIAQALFIPDLCEGLAPVSTVLHMEPARPFALRQLRVKAWQLKKLPSDQRRDAGKSLLRDLRSYLEKLNANLPRSDL